MALVRVECPDCVINSARKLLARSEAHSVFEVKCPRCKRVVRFDRGSTRFVSPPQSFRPMPAHA